MTRDAGGENRLSADEHMSAMTDDLAWAESITLRLADAFPPEVPDGMPPKSVIRKHRAA
jgi:hypothetical protein